MVFSTASWEGRADFSQADVHRQIAIVFKTPPYEDLEIAEPVTVNVFLQRLTDGVCSEPLPFTYLPRDHGNHSTHCYPQLWRLGLWPCLRKHIWEELEAEGRPGGSSSVSKVQLQVKRNCKHEDLSSSPNTLVESQAGLLVPSTGKMESAGFLRRLASKTQADQKAAGH